MYSDSTLNMITSVTVNATVQAVALETLGRLLGMIIDPTGTAGSIVFRNDGPAGVVVLTVKTLASANEITYYNLPATLNFTNGLHVTLTNVNSVELLLG